MSASKKKKIQEVTDKVDGKKPPKEQFDLPEPERYSLSELQDIQSFFFKLSGSKVAKWLAVSAALGATLGGLHVLWLVIRYVAGF
jgi:hypothetical protein